VRDGVRWTPQRLAWTAIMMAWDEGQTMQARFDHACRAGRALHAHWRLGESYSGFAAALARRSDELIPGVVKRFQRQVQRLAGKDWRVRGWLAFAVDGTRLETPHTRANEAGLGCAGREKSAPQVFLTTAWHMGLGLPWDFRTGPGTDSERRHLETMLASLPTEALVVADAGFCGYELCRTILAAGCSFLFRIGGNVTLLTDLGWHVEQRGDLVSLWPQDFRDQPPLTLRLIVLPRDRQAMSLLTNVLDPEQLSVADAQALYERRWGAEVGFRSFKQTLDRRILLSRTPATCLLEAGWTLLGLWLLGLLCVSRQLTSAGGPRRWSTAAARNVVRRVLRQPDRRRPRGALQTELRQARHDGYARIRPKAARRYPRKKREKPPGPPKIKPATPLQIQQAKALQRKYLLLA
jgi:Transposase DDE domain